MIAEHDWYGLSPKATYDIYLAREKQIDDLMTKIGDLEEELEQESR